MKQSLLVFSLAVLLGGCTWVKLSPEGENVAVLTADDVTNCMRIGDTTASVVDRIGIQRSDEKVEEELKTLARNSAAMRGADTIVPATPVQDGVRTYDIYRCRR